LPCGGPTVSKHDAGGRAESGWPADADSANSAQETPIGRRVPAATDSGRWHDRRGHPSTRDDIEALSAHANLNILLTHEAPTGVRFHVHPKAACFVSEVAGLDSLLAATRPRICFFGHHHARFEAEVADVPCIGLGKVGRLGNLLAIEMRQGDRTWRKLGEWPVPSARR
jgi:hypothetical protein